MADTIDSSTDFPGVEKLGGATAKTAAEKLTIAAKDLEQEEHKVSAAARRIREIDHVVGSLPFPAVERLLAPDRLLSELDDVQAQPVRQLHTLRNQTALAPLVLTWLSIGLAVIIRVTSLLVPIYSTVAIVDALLIGSVVFLTRMVHVKEKAASKEYYRIAEHVDDAVKALALAMAEHDTAKDPANPEEWARSAREVLEETRRQTAELYESTQATIGTAGEKLASVHAETEKLVGQWAVQIRKTLESLQQANEQIVERVAKEAAGVLNSAVAEDRALVNEHLAPLVEQLQANVESFTRGFDTYQEDIATFVSVTSDVGVATKALGESTASYTHTAEAIEAHLRSIEGSQQAFIENVTQSAHNMGTAAGAMETMSTLLSDRLRADLERITVQLTSSSDKLAIVDQNLIQTTAALSAVSGHLATVTPRRRWRLWPGRG